ncbi:hypothetical protein BC332_16359 [Capsicum chinense]|nr:hypothetical protein BC332_16359 [Capsicum chinense]
MPAGAETSRPLLEEHGNSTKDEVNRVKPLKDVKNQQRKSCPTWWLLLLVSIFGVASALMIGILFCVLTMVKNRHPIYRSGYVVLIFNLILQEQRMNKFPIYPKYEAGDYCGYEFDPQTDYTDQLRIAKGRFNLAAKEKNQSINTFLGLQGFTLLKSLVKDLIRVGVGVFCSSSASSVSSCLGISIVKISFGLLLVDADNVVEAGPSSVGPLMASEFDSAMTSLKPGFDIKDKLNEIETTCQYMIAFRKKSCLFTLSNFAKTNRAFQSIFEILGIKWMESQMSTNAPYFKACRSIDLMTSLEVPIELPSLCGGYRFADLIYERRDE